MNEAPKKRKKRYKIETYDDIQLTLEALFNQVARDEEDNYQKVNVLAKLLDLRLKALKQNELQVEVDRMNAMLEEWKDSQRGDY